MTPFTHYPEVNLLLDMLLPGAQSILGANFTGMYLFGSLAAGGFDRNSDVDVLVVSDQPIGEVGFTALNELHARLSCLDTWCADQLEAIYIHRAALRRYDPADATFPRIDRGPQEVLQHIWHDRAGWLVHNDVLWRCGVTLSGPPPRELIDPVDPAELRQAMREIFQSWALPMLDNPEQITHRGYQSYIVLSLCRLLYTIRFGAVVSKKQATEWASPQLGQPWSRLIERAWVSRSVGSGDPPDDEDKTATLALIEHIRDNQKLHAI